MLLRLAEPDDAIAVARLHILSWQVAYRTLLPSDFLAQLRPEDRTARYDFATLDPLKPRTVVAVEEGAILGFATTAPSHEADLPNYGELCALHVDPQHWNRGVGVALISDARARLRELGYTRALLWVVVGNVRAERFYRLDGWAPDGAQKMDILRDVAIDEIRYQCAL